MKKSIAAAYFALCFAFMFSMNVSAYLDPAVTTYIIQIVAGAFVVGGALIGIFRHKIKRLFSKNKNTGKTEKKINNENTDDMFD